MCIRDRYDTVCREAIGAGADMNKHYGCYYIAQAVSTGIPQDMCTLPLVEVGVAVEDLSLIHISLRCPLRGRIGSLAPRARGLGWM